MISLLQNTNNQIDPLTEKDEEELINIIYRFANKKDEWFNLLLSLSNCISIAETLPASHPYQNIADRLLDHIKNAIKISARLNISSSHENATGILEHIPMGAGIIDQKGRLVEVNQQARQMLENDSNWKLTKGYLKCEKEDFFDKLNGLVHSYRYFLSIDIDPSRRIFFTAIPKQDDDPIQRFYFCIESHRNELIRSDFLKQRFKLTNTEVLIVEAMIKSLSTVKTAKQLKLKEPTVREHLSNIYAKLDVTRKPEMIQKVLLQSLTVSSGQALTQPIASYHANAVSPRTESILLKDGRRLSYAIHESPSENNIANMPKKNILILHNLMGSALELPPNSEKLFLEQNLRFIVPERPGYGESDPNPKGNHQSFCQDIEYLLNELDLPSVSVIAHSIGGAYALALAEFLPGRVDRIAMVNSTARIEDLQASKPVPVLVTAVLQSLKFAPFIIEPVLKMAVGRSIEQFYEQQLNYIRPTLEGRASDINLLRSPTYRRYSISNLKRSAKQGIHTWVNELKLSFNNWSFEVKNQDVEYQFWHGEHDDVIPAKAIKQLANSVNTIQFNYFEDETHFLFARRFNEVVTQLIR